MNGPTTDLSQLRAIPLERRSWTAAEVERWIAAAKAANGWLVFFSHDVSDDPSPLRLHPRHARARPGRGPDAGFDLQPVDQVLARATA